MKQVKNRSSLKSSRLICPQALLNQTKEGLQGICLPLLRFLLTQSPLTQKTGRVELQKITWSSWPEKWLLFHYLTPTAPYLFIYKVGTDVQKRFFFVVPKKKKKDPLFFFSVQMCGILQHSARPAQYLIEITQEEDTEGRLNSEYSAKVHLFYMRHTICLIPTCISGSLETFKLHL